MTIKRDYTGPSADDRVLRINLGVVRYGTNDKTQGAAVIFALLIFGVICLLFVLSLFIAEGSRVDSVMAWLSNAFLFVLGIATGNSNSSNRG